MQYSIVNYSQISKSLFRLEAEFYNSNSLLDSYSFSGEDVIDFVQYGTSEELNEEKRGYPTLRLNEFSSFFIKHPQKYCDKIDDETYQSLALKKGDVLICRTNGSPRLVGKSAIVPEDCNYAFASYLFRVRPKEEILLPTTLVTYLNSAVGRAEIEKHLMVSNQANFSPAKFREILIPQFGEEIQSRIDKSVWESYSKHSKSKQIYMQSQTLLLSELDLVDWQPSHRLAFVKNLSDVQKANRIDAEYLQPKYEEIEETIKSYANGYALIRDEFSQNKSTFTIDDEQLYRYVEIRDVNVSNGEITANGVLGEDLPVNAKRVLEKGDVIISKVRTYRGAITIVEESGYVGSGAFCVLRENGDINKETLLAFLHSKPLLAWSLKPNTGTSYPVIVDDDILNLPIPILPKERQAQIKQKVIESFNLRKQSKQLLECAKRAVEIAIEEDEQTAIEWLENATDDFHH